MVYAQIDIANQFAPAAKVNTISSLLNVALPLLMTGAGLICLVMMLFAGLNIITHGDNPDAIKKAYSTITYSVMGLVIVVISFLAVRLLGKMLGVEMLF